jgi:hypothetical protein
VPVLASYLDSPEFAHRIGALRALGLAFALILAGITTGISMVVWFALDGVPLAGNLYKVGGVPVPTIVAGVIVLLTPVAAVLVGRAQGRAGMRQIAVSHPELAGSADEAERLADAFSAVVHAESAMTLLVGFGCAVLFHVTTDPVLLVGVGFLVLILVVRRPSLERARTWMATAADAVHRDRQVRR